MATTTISNLSDEVLAIVFQKLDRKSLLNSTLVCKIWNHEICNSTSLMRRLKFVVRMNYAYKQEEWNERIRQALIIARKLVNIELREVKNRDEDILRVVSAHSISLRSLTMSYCVFDAKQMMNILSTMENLDSLDINHCSIASAEGFAVQEFRRLKTLKLRNCTKGFLNLLSGSQLDSLDFDVDLIPNESALWRSRVENIKSFLASQRSLRSLKIETDLSIITGVVLNDIEGNLHLNNFKITSPNSDGLYSKPTHMKFLQRHGNLLESMEVNFTSAADLRFVLKKLKSLKTALTYFGECNVSSEFLSLELKLAFHLRTEEILIRAFQTLPALDSLTLDCSVSESVLELIENSQENLKSLTIEDFDFSYKMYRTFKKIKLPKLQELHFKGSHCAFVHEFIVNNQIEMISIKYFDCRLFNIKTFFESLTRSSTKQIKIECSTLAMKRFLKRKIGLNKFQSLEWKLTIGTDIGASV